MTNKKPFLVFLFLPLMVITGWVKAAYCSSATHGTEKPVLLVEGLVTTDGVPCKAIIEIHSNHLHHRTIVTIQSDSLNGSFFTSLAAGDDYDLVVKTPRLPQQVLSVSTRHLDSTIRCPVFADFISPGYDKKLEELKRDVKRKEAVDKGHSEVQFSEQFGNTKREDLHFKVQIAAYRFFENFNYNNVLGLPEIIRKTDNDYITRFTMGDYATYNEALSLLKQTKSKGLKESFVVAYYKGKRYSLSELRTILKN